MKRKLAVALAVVSGVYLFVPEPTDLVPFIGWLDEGLALALFNSCSGLDLARSSVSAGIDWALCFREPVPCHAASRAFSASARHRRSVRAGSWNTNIFCKNTGECSPDDKMK